MLQLIKIMKIVSLIPSATEIIAALGFKSYLVGRSHECDFPKDVNKLAICTLPKINPEKPSIKIHEDITELLKKALSIYDVRVDILEKLKPDLIITQSQCDVCAVSLKEVEKAVCSLTNSNVKIISLEPNSLSDIFEDIKKVAKALKVPEKGDKLIKKMKSEIEKIKEKSKNLQEKRVACIEWIEPLMAAGNWMPELVSIAKGKNIFGIAGKHSSWIKFEDLKNTDPDIIVILPCGFNIERTKKEMGPLTSKEDWSSLKAVKSKNVFLTDGNQYFNRPGPRIVDSLKILAEIFHPEVFNFNLQGKGWEKWN